MSGEGAAVRGARFNTKGVPALYLSLSIEGAVKEANQGFAAKINPCVLCSYEVDCQDIADLRTELERTNRGVALADMLCAWLSFLTEGSEPPSWQVARRLSSESYAGIIIPSFALGATSADQSLVLWDWNNRLPHQVKVFDPSGRLPKNQLSWD